MSFQYIFIKYKKDFLPMSAFVAWLWAFPLFGFLQEIINIKEQLLTYFNISFLAGTSLCFLFFAFSTKCEFKKIIVLGGPLFNLVITLFLFINFRIMPVVFLEKAKLLFFIFIPLLMGVCTASFFVFWGSTIYQIDNKVKGRYMGQMMAAASLFCMVVFLISNFSIMLSVIFSAGLLILPSLQFSKIIRWAKDEKKYALITKKNSKVQVSPENRKHLSSSIYFWLPLSVVLCSFYILSWITNNTIFPFIREGFIIAPCLGQITYGTAALAGGCFLDSRRKVELLAVLGIISLGCTFLFLPIAVKHNLLIPLQIFLEASYAFIDLFLWILLAVAAVTYRGRPCYYYSIGLFLNIFFIMAGIGFKPFMESLTEGYNIFYISSIAAAMLLCGTVPALALGRFRYGQDEVGILENKVETIFCEEETYTPREKEVLNLLLTDMDNKTIQSMLGITRNTLKSHIRHIYGKAKVKNRVELLYKFSSKKR